MVIGGMGRRVLPGPFGFSREATRIRIPCFLPMFLPTNSDAPGTHPLAIQVRDSATTRGVLVDPAHGDADLVLGEWSLCRSRGK